MTKLLLALILFIPFSGLHAAGGSISGTVIGKDEADPLIGVNILLRGSVRGTSTNSEGKFRITDLTPGTYTLQFSLVGYQREIRSDIVVEDERATIVNVSMSVKPVQTDQVVTTANKREQSLQDVPVSIAVMDATELHSRNAQTIEDAMRYIPGVNVTGGQVNIRGSSGYTKGAGSRIILLLDGVPFISGDTGELIFESIPVGQIDRIEVVKGASSALYGSSALGGVINIITKPISDVPETFIRTYGGLYNKPTYETWNWTNRTLGFGGLALGQSVSFGDLRFALSLSRQVSDSYQQNDYYRRYNVYVKAREEFSPSNSLTMNFGLLSQSRGQHNWWENLDSALYVTRDQRDDGVTSSRYYVSGLYNDAVSDNLLLTAKAIWNHNGWTSIGVHNSQLEPQWEPLPSGRFAETLESKADGYELEGGVTWIANDSHTMTLGITGQYNKIVSDPKFFGEHAGWGAALFGQDEWKYAEHLTLTYGARMDVQKIGIADAGPQFNPKIALSYKASEGTTLRGSFGKGFRVPSAAELFISLPLGSGINSLPNADLKAEHSYSYEIGVAQQLGELGMVDIAAFRSDYNNLIEPTPFQDSNGEYKVQWQNTPKARVQGIEATWKLGFFDGDLLWNFGYTYAYAEDLTPRIFSGVDSIVNARPNNVLPYRPKHVLTTGLVGRSGIFSSGIDFRYLSRVDRVFDLFVNTRDFFIPNADERVAILVTDVRLGADLSTLGVPLTATLNINNIFRYNYLELTANMSPPRTFVFVLEAKL